MNSRARPANAMNRMSPDSTTIKERTRLPAVEPTLYDSRLGVFQDSTVANSLFFFFFNIIPPLKLYPSRGRPGYWIMPPASFRKIPFRFILSACGLSEKLNAVSSVISPALTKFSRHLLKLIIFSSAPPSIA